MGGGTDNGKFNRLWAQKILGYCTVQSCHNSSVYLDTLWDNCVLLVLLYCTIVL